MKTLKSSFFFLMILIITCSTQCNEDSKSTCESPLVFQDMSNLAGCGYILVLNSGDDEKKLEPTNLSDFDIAPVEGLKVCATYTEKPDMASICQVGEIVELTSLSLFE